MVVLQQHTWYLTEDCISIALFNPDLEDEEKNKLAQKIGELPTTQLEIRKPTLPTVSARTKITDFVGQRSILLFSLLKMDHKFLLQENWKETDKYDAARKDISGAGTIQGVTGTIQGGAGTLQGVVGTIQGEAGTIQGVAGTIQGVAGTIQGFKSKADLKKLF